MNDNYHKSTTYILALASTYGLYRIINASVTTQSSKRVYGVGELLTILASKATDVALPLVYIGLVPDFVIRFGIRLQLRHRIVCKFVIPVLIADFEDVRQLIYVLILYR